MGVLLDKGEPWEDEGMRKLLRSTGFINCQTRSSKREGLAPSNDTEDIVFSLAFTFGRSTNVEKLQDDIWSQGSLFVGVGGREFQEKSEFIFVKDGRHPTWRFEGKGVLLLECTISYQAQ